MRTFRTSITVILLLFITSASAQHIQLSPMSLDEIGMDYVRVIGQDEAGYSVLLSNLSLDMPQDRVGLRSRKYRLSYFDKDLKIRWWKNVVQHPIDAETDGVVFFQDHPVAINSRWERQTGKFTFYIDVYDSAGNCIIAGKEIASFNLERNATMAKPRFQLSASREKLGILLEVIRDKDELFCFCTVDEHYATGVVRSAVAGYSRKEMDAGNFAVSDNNDLALVTELTDPSGNSKEWRRPRLIRLFHLGADRSSFREYEINRSAQPMTEAQVAVDEINNNIVVAGFYADKNSYAGAGIAYARIPLNGIDSMSLRFMPLVGDARLQLLGERNSGSSIGLFAYPIQQLVLRSDGGAVILAEAAYLSEYSYYDYFTQSFNRRLEFHYDNVVALSIDKNGKVDWGHVLRKEQTSLDDEGVYSSFCSLLNAEEMLLLYNEDIGRNNSIAGFSISNKGVQTTLRFTKPGENITLLPHSGKQVAADEFLIPVISKKRLFLAKMSR